MFKKEFTQLADVLIEKEISKNEDRDIIIHGLSSGIELVFSVITTITLGFAFGLLVESLIFLISFSFIRTYAGGYHCQKAINCYFFSSGIVVLVLVIVKFTPTGYILATSLAMLTISVPIILKLSPMETETKPLDEVEKEHYRRITIQNLIIECLIISVLFVTGINKFAFVISLGVMVSAGVVVLQRKIINKI